MNNTLEQFARANLKEELAKLPESNHKIFKLMYGRNNGKRSVQDAEAMDVNAVVDEMEIEKLDWAMQQVANSVAKLDAECAVMRDE